MLAGKEGELQRMMDKLNKISTEYGMKINTKKTKLMRISRIEEHECNNRRRKDRTGLWILQPGQPNIRGCKMPYGNQETNRMCPKRKELLKGWLSRDIKKIMVKALIWSVTLYGAETWTMRKEDKLTKRKEVFEMWVWRRMERISYKEHKTKMKYWKGLRRKGPW